MRFHKLHSDFGAEVLDVDASHPITPQAIEELRAAFDEHQLLLIRSGRRMARV
ncbi:MAG TPA: hypothetical protein VK437_10340 [Steroidobacteraceae bacterium]|nr:hypothetical protein [Steroidobacteraceae bacterium]